jgi:hypothetical protein
MSRSGRHSSEGRCGRDWVVVAGAQEQLVVRDYLSEVDLRL